MTRASLTARVDALVRAAQRDAELRAAAPLSHDIARLSRAFTTEQAHRRPDYMADPRMRRAYLAFFVPQYAAKIAQILERYSDEGLLKLPARPRILDVGAGPLTGTLGAALYAGELGPSTAIDLARAALDAGAQLARTIGVHDVTLVEASLVGPLARVVAAAPVDLVIVAHVLNELGDPRRAVAQRAQLLTHLVQQLAPGGRVLVVEPGTRVHGRALMAVRDALIGERRVSVLGPCRGAKACPLLQTPGDWCHAELAWDRPPSYVALETAAGLTKDVLKASTLLLARPTEPEPHLGGRLVGGLMRGRDRTERRYVCGPGGLVTITGTPQLPPAVAKPMRGELLRVLPQDVAVRASDRERKSRKRTSGPRRRR